MMALLNSAWEMYLKPCVSIISLQRHLQDDRPVDLMLFRALLAVSYQFRSSTDLGFRVGLWKVHAIFLCFVKSKASPMLMAVSLSRFPRMAILAFSTSLYIASLFSRNFETVHLTVALASRSASLIIKKQIQDHMVTFSVQNKYKKS